MKLWSIWRRPRATHTHTLYHIICHVILTYLKIWRNHLSKDNIWNIDYCAYLTGSYFERVCVVFKTQHRCALSVSASPRVVYDRQRRSFLSSWILSKYISLHSCCCQEWPENSPEEGGLTRGLYVTGSACQTPSCPLANKGAATNWCGEGEVGRMVPVVGVLRAQRSLWFILRPVTFQYARSNEGDFLLEILLSVSWIEIKGS